jgi:hypothetical protein
MEAYVLFFSQSCGQQREVRMAENPKRSTKGAINRRKNDYTKMMRRQSSVKTPTLAPPVVVGLALSDPKELTFGAFLQLPGTRELFGLRNDAATMIAELVTKREFLLARSGGRDKNKNRSRWRRLLANYVRRAYLGDERGLLYWRRVAKVIWVAYENMLRLKRWAAHTRDYEVERIARWETRAEKERLRQKARRRRVKRKA